MAAKPIVHDILQRKTKLILETWMKQQMSEAGLREDLMSNDELKRESDQLLKALVEATKTDVLDDIYSPEFEQITELIAGISMNRAKKGFSPRETGFFVLSLKESLIKVMEQEVSDSKKLFVEVVRVNKMIDSLATLTFESYIRGREEVILRQTDEISEISTPVIQVWDGILALPIIGTLDSARTQVVMESLLMKIVETESTIAILDISGVPAVDSLVAQHLIKTVSATRLMGAECIISGIRPEIAQTIVHLGIDLSSISTKSSLAHALRFAFQILKLQVVKQTPR